MKGHPEACIERADEITIMIVDMDSIHGFKDMG